MKDAQLFSHLQGKSLFQHKYLTIVPYLIHMSHYQDEWSHSGLPLTTSQLPTGWHRADIIAALHKKGISLAQLARENLYASSTVQASLHVARKPANIIIAEAVGASLHELWPHWYDAEGNRIAGRDSARPRASRSSPIARRSRLKRRPRLTLLQGGAR